MDAILSALLIFCLRLADVSLGTLRIQFLVQRRKRLAGIVAFFESLIWTIAAVQVLGDLDEPVKVIGYAAGYAVGTMLGGFLESRIALGDRLVRVVAPRDTPPVGPVLHDAGYPVTILDGEGRYGQVRVSFSVIPRRRVDHVMALIHAHNPEAFVTVEESTRTNGVLPANAIRK